MTLKEWLKKRHAISGKKNELKNLERQRENIIASKEDDVYQHSRLEFAPKLGRARAEQEVAHRLAEIKSGNTATKSSSNWGDLAKNLGKGLGAGLESVSKGLKKLPKPNVKIDSGTGYGFGAMKTSAWHPPTPQEFDSSSGYGGFKDFGGKNVWDMKAPSMESPSWNMNQEKKNKKPMKKKQSKRRK